MAYYKDLREFLVLLEEKGKLVRVKRPINKDTELHPLVRLQFRGLPEEERKAFLFENVVDSTGKRYKGTVATGAAAPSREIYTMGLRCEASEIGDRWAQARLNPIPPRILESGPVQEEVHLGDGLLEHGGLDEFPFTISTPGYDSGPYFTAPCWISKDPETGDINVGTYRSHVKSPTRSGLMWARPTQHMAQHWMKYRKLGKPMEVAVAQGVAPNINYVSVAKLAYGENEWGVAGGFAGEPVELVKCKTVDLEVPAYAEIVVEGEVSVMETEPEGPFGETFGYMGEASGGAIFNVKCITHRKDPIFQSFFSEFPPSESTIIRGIARGTNIYKQLRHDLGMNHVLSVVVHNDTSATGVFVISMKPGTEQGKVWEALEKAYEALSRDSVMVTKIVIAVDDDIDPQDAASVNWAMSFRMQPYRDVRIHTYPAEGFLDWSMGDPSIVSPAEIAARASEFAKHPPTQSMMLINATMKWDFRPMSLPSKEFMDHALELWQELKLPQLRLREPWWGRKYALWSEDEEQRARMAVEGRWLEVGEMLAKRRKKIT